VYFVVEQPDVDAKELMLSSFLKGLSADKDVRTGVMVGEVVGMKGAEGEELARFIGERYGAESKIIRKTFPALSGSMEEREEMMRDHGECFYPTLPIYRSSCPKDIKFGWIE
jgi:hypothetical protein